MHAKVVYTASVKMLHARVGLSYFVLSSKERAALQHDMMNLATMYVH